MSGHIRALRMKCRLRQRDVAAELGITDHQIRKWERGLAVPPPPVIRALAKLFGVSPSNLERAQIFYAASVAPGEGYTTARPPYSGIEEPVVNLPSSRLRVLDLFCGAGGLSFGLELTKRFTTVAGFDLLPDRIATFRANHPHATGFVGDIRDFPVNELTAVAKGVDVVVGGAPCQGFSSIRPFRVLTEGDKRNTLVEHFLMWVSAIKPRWFVFENVVGILTHHQGRMLQSLLDGFEDCGYTVSWRIMNTSLYGIPQNRERLVIVGDRIGATFLWPMPSYRNDYKSMAGPRPEVIRNSALFSEHLPKAITLIDAIGDLPEVKSGQSSEFYKGAPQNKFQKWTRGESITLTMHEATRHSKHMLEIIKYAGPNISAIPKRLITSGFSSCYSRLDADSPSTTLTVNFVHPASNRCIHPFQDRALTPREGARIQSFPDSFKFCGTRAQIVKQIGNAVPPLLAQVLGEAIAKADTQTTVDCENTQAAQPLIHVTQPGYEQRNPSDHKDILLDQQTRE